MFVDKVRVEGVPSGYLAALPAVRSLSDAPLTLTRPVTVFTGENGAGKSTLVEALAVAAGANPEGGSRNAQFTTSVDPVSKLSQHIVLTRSRNARDVFFLRGETYSGLARYYEGLPGDPLAGMAKLSHGQGLMHLARERFGAGALLFLDEPEDGLSVLAQLELLGILWHLADRGSQIIMSTHSPVLLGIPGAQLLEVGARGIAPTAFEESEAVRAWEEFITDPVGTASFLVKP
ncbi:AAA family ATPase [Corynebacterium qintianiae]|uniref:AAA family ATPase n=1 Tax=Corynebacterium qintianiae TaxID=2709392 RepID=A0A7T0KMF5_9CORY|nr:AAA family ATPase [Corynebacterium qintianiae]QPK83197.1 AAA family ATPase [Corynebacterium qintianiae]